MTRPPFRRHPVRPRAGRQPPDCRALVRAPASAPDHLADGVRRSLLQIHGAHSIVRGALLPLASPWHRCLLPGALLPLRASCARTPAGSPTSQTALRSWLLRLAPAAGPSPGSDPPALGLRRVSTARL